MWQPLKQADLNPLEDYIRETMRMCDMTREEAIPRPQYCWGEAWLRRH